MEWQQRTADTLLLLTDSAEESIATARLASLKQQWRSCQALSQPGFPASRERTAYLVASLTVG